MAADRNGRLAGPGIDGMGMLTLFTNYEGGTSSKAALEQERIDLDRALPVKPVAPIKPTSLAM